MSRCAKSCLILFLLALAAALLPRTAPAQRSGGDQFVDGIGETALIARYPLDGDGHDASRNQRHAKFGGPAPAFVTDEQFGRVLTLAADKGQFLELPGDALAGVDSLSVAAWIQPRVGGGKWTLFDFGVNRDSRVGCVQAGEADDLKLRVLIGTPEAAAARGPIAPAIKGGRWVHVAVVFDAANKAAAIYLDGRLAAEAGELDVALEDMLGVPDAHSRLRIGKSLGDAPGWFDGRLHDLRIYSVALAPNQVATIYRNAIGDDADAELAAAADGQPVRPAVGMAGKTPALSRKIASIPDVSVETVVGTLPRLPLEIPAVYADGQPGPNVRVIWPAPRDNSTVAAVGTYTIAGRVPGADVAANATVNVGAKVVQQAAEPVPVVQPFALGQVTLNSDEQGRATPFIRNRDKFFRGLRETNPDSFLYMFRDAFGQEQPPGATPLGVWDSQTTRLRGHATGHYLSALAQAYASTAYDSALQDDFKRKMDYVVDVLFDLSQKSGQPAEPGGPSHADPATVPPGPDAAGYNSDLSVAGIRNDFWNWGVGYISAYPPDQFIMLEHGATYGGGNDQIWAPYYTLHKILAGLLDCYEIGHNERALEVAQGMGTWVCTRLERVPPQTRIRMWNRYIAGEYGGMNEAMARLYRLTRDERFLSCAKLFDNIDFFFGNAERAHGLAANVDTLRGKHANQHVPQITGALATYRCTGEPAYFHVADNFWHLCTGSYMYAIGGVAGARHPDNAECFTAEPDSLYANGFSRGGQNETCATYNLLKLSRQLFLHRPDGQFMDYYEQALYNHILASVAEHDPGNTYHVPLNPGARKQFGNADMRGFTCCNGTALESSTKLQDSIYFRSADNEILYVNLFVPSTLKWSQRNVTVTQLTSFPYADGAKLVVAGEGDFALRIRRPRWAGEDFAVLVNGEEATSEPAENGYVGLRRAWRDGDVVEVRLPFSFRLHGVMDRPNIAAIFYGPILLAVEEASRLDDWRSVALDLDDLSQSIQGDPNTLRFRIGELRLRPFFETYGRYSAYLDVSAK